MRGTRLIPIALIALALAGCMQRQPAYYVLDPATGRMTPLAQSTLPPGYAPAYGQPGYAQPAYPRQSYAAASPQPVYTQPLPPSQPAYQPAAQPAQSALVASPKSTRGMFSSSSPAVAQKSYAEVQPVQVQPVQPPHTQPAYTQPVYGSYAQTQPVYAQPAYTQPAYTQPVYGSYAAAPAAALQSSPVENRGLITAPPRAQPRPPAYAAPQVAARPYSAPANSYASVNSAPQSYTLDAGDKLRVVVFGQDGITNSYMVGVDGQVNLPLVGNLPARGFTTSQLAQMIAERLKQGYVREPHVSVEVETYRPFFILGEVTTPGQYPYVANMTAETAVAIAGGFSPRADKRMVQLSRNAPGQQIKGDVPLSYPLRPGDTVMVKERWF